MADPIVKTLTKDVWTLITTSGSGVTSGMVHIMDKSPNVYLQTYRATGGTAPTDKSDAVPIVDRNIPISASAPIDIYIQPVGKDGKIRIDI